MQSSLGEAARLQRLTRASQLADWPNVAVRFKMLIERRVGLTLGLGRSLMHGVAPQMCGRVASPLLGLGAGGCSPGYLMPPRCGVGANAASTCQRAQSVASAIGSPTSTRSTA